MHPLISDFLIAVSECTAGLSKFKWKEAFHVPILTEAFSGNNVTAFSVFEVGL